MIRRLLVILPPPAFLIALASGYTTIELPFWLARLRWGVAAADKHPGLAIVVFAAVAYGVYRVVAFHPFFRPDYRDWLARTPWTSRKPLPVGPVSWVPEDVLIVGVLAVLSSVHNHPDVDPVVIATLPLMSYAAVLMTTLFATGTWGFGYATAFALGLATWLGPNRWAFLASAVGVNLIAHIGLRRSLARFPWTLERQAELWQSVREAFGEKRADSQSRCGWPHDRLLRDPSTPYRIGLADAALVSMIAGWWLFALTSLIDDPFARGPLLVMILFVGTVATFAVRLLVYCVGYTSPLNLWGRIVTFRWIVPGYDRVFIGPACTLLAPCLGLAALRRGGMPITIAVPLCFALMLFVALSCAPSLERWRLTGRHRIVPGLQQKQKNEYIQVG